VDLRKLAAECQGLIAFSPEGASLMIEKGKLTDNEALQLWLLAAYLGSQLGKLKQEDMSKDELQERIAKSGKIVSTRLGELVKNGLVAKASEDRFRITTYGIVQMQKDLFGKVRAKLDV
jgi:predicted transcriptional regulator